jgi:peptidoglycan/xylan/chitin deacetylase (PgdA/CDA1 family)
VLGCRVKAENLPVPGAAGPTAGSGSPGDSGGRGGSLGEPGSTAGMGGGSAPAGDDAAAGESVDAIPISIVTDAALQDTSSDVVPEFAVTGVATWRGGATAAYSIVHDTVCDPGAEGALTQADPELTVRGLRGGFGVIVRSCDALPSQWPQIMALVAHGHEVYNHSWSHPCLGTAAQCGANLRSTDFAVEIDQSTQVLAMQAGITPQYFSFPFDICGQDAVTLLRTRGYLGARCGTRGVSPPDLADTFATRFDQWGPSFSIYGNTGPCAGTGTANTNTSPELRPVACRRYVLNHFVDEAVAQQGWAMRAFTGFLGDAGAFQPVSLEDYTAHLDYVRTQVEARLLWMDGPTAVLKYRWARQLCPLPTVIDGRTLHFAAPTAVCQRYATQVSYLVSATMMLDAPDVTAIQGGIATPTARLGRAAFMVTADPTGGDVLLSQ